MPVDFIPRHLPVWLGRLGIQQDWFWFTGLLFWSLALVLWSRSRRRDPAWAWLPWVAGAGVLGAVAQFWAFNPPFGCFYDRLVPGTSSLYVPALIDPNLFVDVVLALVFAAVAAGWCWQMLSGTRTRALRWPAVALIAAVAAVQVHRPVLGGTLLAVLMLPGAVWWWTKNHGRPLARAALVTVALRPGVSTVGPLAAAFHALQRHHPATAFGLVGALASILGAGLVLAALGGEILAETTAADRRALWRDARPFALGALVWLTAGLVYAINTGRDNCDEVRTNRLRLVASRAEALDPNVIAPLADPRFHLNQRPGGGGPGRGFSSYLATGVARPAQRTLRDIVQSTPFLETARFVTLRDGWLVAPASNQLPALPGVVEILRPASPADRTDWDGHRNVIERSPVPEIRQPYYCRAAVTDADGRMLGWLEYVREEFYSTVERKWRAEPLLVSALGPVLAAILLAQRRSARARETAVREAAVAAKANQLKTAFLANVSHELRTPLQSILGYCDLLQRAPAGPDSTARLAALRQNGELMLRLVNDLLDLGAIEAGALRFVERPVDLARLVGETVAALRARAVGKGLALDYAADPAVPAWVATDPERIRQIALNLIGNAIKFTDRGRIDVSLTVTATRDTGSLIELAVADTGPGIARADQAQLFQPFSRLDLTAAKEGAGLGLALVAALCRRVGGEVSVESERGRGARFCARLPLRPAAAPAPTRPAAAFPSLQGKRVVIADDNRLVRELFAAWLTEAGASCETAADGEQALALAAAGAGCDALVLDLAMPRLDGLEAARRLRAGDSGGRLRLVAASAHARPDDRAAAFAAGVDVFLTKPVNRTELVSALVGGSGAAADEATPHRIELRLAELFRAELPAQEDALSAARARADWPAVADRAHWLKNSAAVLHDLRLFASCTALEEAAELARADAVDAAWAACRAALAEWGPRRPGRQDLVA